jgi:methylmalonyl-CoA mutase cobalamin-binding subunit
LRGRLQELLGKWQAEGLPARATLDETARALLSWRHERGIDGLWKRPPRMLGATMDDGWGHGIQLILRYAAAMGVETGFIGLLKTWEQIVPACEAFKADYLGLTVLQFDTLTPLIELRHHLPRSIKIIAGGPVFRIDPQFQEQAGIDHVAPDAAGFIRLLLATAPP